MLRRFRLDQKGRFEKLVIAQRLSDMLDKVLSGRSAPLLIGAEQGEVSEWDDIVVYHVDGRFEHLQIKRQTTPFCDKHLVKDDYIASYTPRKQNTKAPGGNPPSVIPPDSEIDSVLDKAMKSLAAWSTSVKATQPPARTFTLVLLGLEVLVKGKPRDAITANHLHEFCRLCRLDGLDADRFAERADQPTQNVYKWLTTWCGFTGWEHVQRTMRLVTIQAVGSEETLEDRARESLNRHYTDDQRALDALIEYISANTSDVNAVGPQHVTSCLQPWRRPEGETWTQYRLNSPPSQGWSIAGTHSLSTLPSVPPLHPASEVVGHHWGGGGNNRKLRLHAPYCLPTPNVVALPSAILRLALHLKAGSHCLLMGMPLWQSGAQRELGSTLGSGERDLEDLPWIDAPQALSCETSRTLSTHVEAREESSALHDAMNNVVWERLQIGITTRLGVVTDLPLLKALEGRWHSWVATLSSDIALRESFFEQLMYPKTEGLDGKHALRVGPRTLELLETALLMLLLVCVATDDEHSDWRTIPALGDVLGIALRNWSGVLGDNGGVRPVSENLMAVLGPSPMSVVVLSGVEGSPTSLLEGSMADDLEATTSMAAQRQPRLLVTQFGILKYLRSGTLTQLQAQFKRHWDAWSSAREAAIEAHEKGI